MSLGRPLARAAQASHPNGIYVRSVLVTIKRELSDQTEVLYAEDPVTAGSAAG
jgi:hypothetical protein